ncbi:MAG: hypothetical protein ACXVRW_01770 [Solirubrobacteraceae bacterium]
MASQNHSRLGSWSRGRLAQAAVGLGVASSVLATAAVATAAPRVPAAQVPAQASIARASAHTTNRPYSSVTVGSKRVRAGQRVTITGNAPRNARAGKWITLQSDAFASKRTVDGIPAIRTQVLVNGRYSATATIRAGLKPTDYAIMGTFDGRPLDTAAWVTVR